MCLIQTVGKTVGSTWACLTQKPRRRSSPSGWLCPSALRARPQPHLPPAQPHQAPLVAFAVCQSHEDPHSHDRVGTCYLRHSQVEVETQKCTQEVQVAISGHRPGRTRVFFQLHSAVQLPCPFPSSFSVSTVFHGCKAYPL